MTEELLSRLAYLESRLAELENRRELALERLTIRDSRGRTRAILGTQFDDQDVVLQMLAPDGTKRLSLIVLDADATVHFNDGEGMARCALRVTKKGASYLIMQDEDLHSRLEIWTDEEGAPSIHLLNPENEILWEMPERPPEEPRGT